MGGVKKKNALMRPMSFGLKIGLKEREYFTENLALLLKAAVPIGQALESLEETAHSPRMKQALQEMRADIEAGASLSNALERSRIVGDQTLALVRLGEQSGHLVENMQLSAQQEAKRHGFHAKVRSAMIYPCFVLGLTLIVGLSIAWFLLPKLAATFSQLQVTLPLVTRMMIGLGVFLKEYGFIAVPIGFAVSFVLIHILFFARRTKHIGQRMLFATPGISRLMREVETAQFGYLLGTLLNAGLPITKAITLLAESTTAVEYKKFYVYLANALEDGHSFQEAMRSYKGIARILPPSVQQMVVAGERSGSLSEVLTTIGRTYEQKSDITTQNLESILEPILLVIVWVGVMLVAVAVIVPIYSLVGGLGG